MPNTAKFWKSIINAQQRGLRKNEIQSVLTEAYRFASSNPSNEFYSRRIELIKKVDEFHGASIFSASADVSLQLDSNGPRVYDKLLNLDYQDIEDYLFENIDKVDLYVEKLGGDFNNLIKSGVKYDSIYKSDISNHRQVSDHDLYFKKSIALPVPSQEIPLDFDGKLLTFLIAIKKRNSRANIAIENIKKSSGKYFKNVEIILIEDYSDEPFVNRTDCNIVHLISGHYLPSGVWNKSILLNKGMECATAKYVVMSDCDFLYSNIEDVIESVYANYNADNLMFHIPLHETHATDFVQGKKVVQRPKYYPYSYVWIFNRDRVLEINGFNEGFTGWGYEETDLIRRVLSQSSSLVLLDDSRAYHLSHSDSTRVRVDANRELFDKNIIRPEKLSSWVFDFVDRKTGYLVSYFSKKSRGASIDILGNGPSTKYYDFNSGAVKIGFNVAYRYWDFIGVYPEIYICMDKVVCAYHAENIKRLICDGNIKFFILDDVFLDMCPEFSVYINVMTFSIFKKKFELFTTNHITTGSFGARLAVLLGYRRLNIWGMSGEYVNFIEESELISMKDSGLPIDSIFTSSKVVGDILRIKKTPTSNPNYFFDGYQIEGDLYNVPSSPKIYKCQCDFHVGGEVDGSIHKYWWDLFYFDLKKLNISIEVFKDGCVV